MTLQNAIKDDINRLEELGYEPQDILEIVLSAWRESASEDIILNAFLENGYNLLMDYGKIVDIKKD